MLIKHTIIRKSTCKNTIIRKSVALKSFVIRLILNLSQDGFALCLVNKGASSEIEKKKPNEINNVHLKKTISLTNGLDPLLSMPADHFYYSYKLSLSLPNYKLHTKQREKITQ